MPAWDKAKPRSSASDAAYARSLETEAARILGKHVGCLLWDFKQFFDRMNTGMLVQSARRLGYLMTDMRLALQVHVGPRRLHILGMLGESICPLRSILPGCAFSITFTRIYLREEIGRTVEAFHGACLRLTVYVDDVAFLVCSRCLVCQKMEEANSYSGTC